MLAGVDSAQPPKRAVVEAFAAWNECAKKFGWAETPHLKIGGRPQKIGRAMADVGGLLAWRELLEKCGESEFLCGRVAGKDRAAFRFTIDWLCKPANLVKVMDGNYFTAAAKAGNAGAGAVGPPAEPDRHKLRNYRPGGFWPAAWGPRPEDPICRLQPPAMLAEWRRINNVTVAERVVETRAQRLANMIVSYRNADRYDDANRIETELAKMEGRQATLVPAPDVANLGMPPKDLGRGPVQKPRDYSKPMRGPVTDALDLSPPDWDDAIPEGDEALIEP